MSIKLCNTCITRQKETKRKKEEKEKSEKEIVAIRYKLIYVLYQESEREVAKAFASQQNQMIHNLVVMHPFK